MLIVENEKGEKTVSRWEYRYVFIAHLSAQQLKKSEEKLN